MRLRGYERGIEDAKRIALDLIDEFAAMDGLKCWLRGPVEFKNALIARLGWTIKRTEQDAR